ncbi:hypothetical protein FOL47_003272 [Perkinsus chesapeaki]|uniref:RanBD1 domain-containing protein n=1 Tax=Perkinsus chesapeaki TaxID=330153 RepID=A0A7J6N446_PERCH|nr:hypothetical protein FOL47_003272 [Perkinsus chesapeaki]
MSKRVAENQLTKDDAPEEENVEDPGTGREKAAADVIAKRKIVSVRRKTGPPATSVGAEKPSTASETESAASSQNPFANLGTSSKSEGSEDAPKSNNPFAGISFASASKSGGGSLFGDIGKSLSGGTGTGFAAFGGADQSGKSEAGEATSPEEGDASEESEPQPHTVCSGEEGESLLFSSDCKLYKLMKQEDNKDASSSSASETQPPKYKWTERGMGSLRVLKKDGDDSAKPAGRIVVRMKGVWKVILNTPILDADKYELVGSKSVKFFGLDDENAEEGQLASYRVNLLSSENQAQFLKAVKGFSASGASTAAPSPETTTDKKPGESTKA